MRICLARAGSEFKIDPNSALGYRATEFWMPG
jgi:hypothetical protein